MREMRVETEEAAAGLYSRVRTVGGRVAAPAVAACWVAGWVAPSVAFVVAGCVGSWVGREAANWEAQRAEEMGRAALQATPRGCMRIRWARRRNREPATRYRRTEP